MRPLIAVTILVGVALSGCSGRDATPQEIQDLTNNLTADNSPVGMPVDSETARCIADIYLTSDLSDEALDALRDGAPLAPHSESDREALDAITQSIASTCLA